MFLVNEAMVDISVGTAGITAVLGYAVVFFGLVLLMGFIMLVGKIMVAANKKKEPETKSAAPQCTAPVAEPVYAPGAAGKLALHNVEPKTAAMLMAIVADKLGKPINELQFKSIREVK